MTGCWSADVAVIREALPVLRPFLRDAVTSDDTDPAGRNKPDPYGLQLAERRLQKRIAAYVGNDRTDMLTARNHGVRGVLLRTADTTPEALDAVDVVIDDLRELLRNRAAFCVRSPKAAG